MGEARRRRLLGLSPGAKSDSLSLERISARSDVDDLLDKQLIEELESLRPPLRKGESRIIAYLKPTADYPTYYKVRVSSTVPRRLRYGTFLSRCRLRRDLRRRGTTLEEFLASVLDCWPSPGGGA